MSLPAVGDLQALSFRFTETGHISHMPLCSGTTGMCVLGMQHRYLSVPGASMTARALTAIDLEGRC